MITYKAPIICKLRSYISYSPSAIFARCFLGLKHRSKHCPGCTENVAEGFFRGLAEVMKDD